MAAKSRARNFGYAAAAIMAALSVESGREGKYTGRPSMAASCSKRWRNSLFAATPPVTNNVATLQARAAARVFIPDHSPRPAGTKPPDPEFSGRNDADSPRARASRSCQGFSPRLNRSPHVVDFDVTQDRGLDPTVRKIKARSCWTLALVVISGPGASVARGKVYRGGIAVGGELVDDGAARISQSQ